MQIGLNLQQINKNSFGNIDIKGAQNLATTLLNSGMVTNRQADSLIKNLERTSKMRLPKGYTATAEISGIRCLYSTIGKKLQITLKNYFFMFSCKLANEDFILKTNENIFIPYNCVGKNIVKSIKKSIRENLAEIKRCKI